jgi:predicted secreted Zn-dependent protease
MPTLRPALTLATLLALNNAQAGDIYRWTDADGHVHFSDRGAAGSQTVTPKLANTFKPVELNRDYYTSNDAEVHYAYYKVYPLSRHDLARALSQASPIVDKGQHYLGSTHWEMIWHFNTHTDRGLCHIISATAHVMITYTMPELGNESSLPDDVTAAFHDYYGHLLEHEQGHGANGIQAAHELLDTLNHQPPASDCIDAGMQANKTFSDVLAKYRQKDQDYDDRTGHGVTQGANIKNYL